jgi:hypothetical protein
MVHQNEKNDSLRMCVIDNEILIEKGSSLKVDHSSSM